MSAGAYLLTANKFHFYSMNERRVVRERAQ